MNTLGSLAALCFLLQGAPSSKEPAAKQDEKPTKMFLEYRNSDDGITFKLDNGRVELTVPAPKGKGSSDQTLTYKANSMEEFTRLYPELAKKYDLDRFVPKAMKPEALEKWWDEWAKRMGVQEDEGFRKFLSEPPGEMPWANLDRWFDDEHRLLRDLERQLHPGGARASNATSQTHHALFGICVSPVEEALRAQLGLKPHEGMIVREVEARSLAETSGIKQHDVLIGLSGQPILDTGDFRERVMSALQSKEFTVELIRGGKTLNLSIHPAHS